eukprot:RCo047823
MPRNRFRLIHLCELCIDAFNPNLGSLDGHIETFCREQAVAPGPDLEFVSQVVYGCSRHAGLLDVVAREYIRACHRMQSDWTKFRIISYLALVRLGQPLTVSQLRKLLSNYVSPSILGELLGMLFRSGQAREHFLEGWRGHYSDDYLEATVFPHLERHAAEMEELIQHYEDQAKGPVSSAATAALASTKKPCTVPEPFSLTQPAPRIIPEPEVLAPFVRPPPVKDGATAEIHAAVQEFARSRKKISTLSSAVKASNDEALAKTLDPKLAPRLLTLERPTTLAAAQARAEEAVRQSMQPEPRLPP